MTNAVRAPGPSPAPLMSIRDVSRNFGGLQAVKMVSFDISQREIVGLIGPNGAGKTSLFNVISGHLRPSSGKVIFSGKDLTGASAARCARAGIGRTFQIVKPLTTLTVHENVTVGSLLRNPIAVAREKAFGILNRVGMADMADRPAGSLTLESRKRLELARALATEPSMLLLDEILAGLNEYEVNESLHMIRGFAETDGLAIVLIEHNLHAVMSLAHKVIVLDSGEKIAEGAPETIVRDPKVIAAYLGSDDQ